MYIINNNNCCKTFKGDTERDRWVKEKRSLQDSPLVQTASEVVFME